MQCVDFFSGEAVDVSNVQVGGYVRVHSGERHANLKRLAGGFTWRLAALELVPLFATPAEAAEDYWQEMDRIAAKYRAVPAAPRCHYCGAPITGNPADGFFGEPQCGQCQ